MSDKKFNFTDYNSPFKDKTGGPTAFLDLESMISRPTDFLDMASMTKWSPKATQSKNNSYLISAGWNPDTGEFSNKAFDNYKIDSLKTPTDSWWDNFDGSKFMENMGQWGNVAEGAAALGNVYVGNKQYGLAEDQFKEAKKMDARNYNAQVKTTNLSLENQYRNMEAYQGGAVDGYSSLAEYMNKNGLKA